MSNPQRIDGQINNRIDDLVDKVDVPQYNNFKGLVVVVVLLLLLCALLVRGCQPSEAVIAAPTLNLPTDEVTPGSITLTGSGAPGSMIVVEQNGGEINTTQVDASGNWSLETAVETAGDYEFEVLALNTDGAVVERSGIQPLTITAAEIPLTAPTLNLPAGDILAGDLTLTGTGTPGSTAAVFANNRPLGLAEVDPAGQWTLETTLDEAGEQTLVAKAVDDQGQVAATGEPQRVIVMVDEALAIAPLTFTAPDVAAGPLQLTGTSTPGLFVEVFANDASLGTAKVGDDGRWALVARLDEADEYKLIAQAMDADGDVRATAKPQTAADTTHERLAVPPLTFNLPDEEAPAGPLTLAGTGVPGSSVEIFTSDTLLGTAKVDNDRRWALITVLDQTEREQLTARAVADDGDVFATAKPRAPYTFDLTLDSPADDLVAGPLTLTGTGTPGSTVEVLANDSSLGTTEITPNGTWTLNTTLKRAGEFELVAQTIDVEGQATAAAESQPIRLAAGPLTLDTPAEDLVAGPLTLTGTGTPGSTVAVLANDISLGTTEVNDDGTWNLDTTLKRAGEFELVAQTIDAAGQVTTAAESQPMQVAAEPPTLDAPAGALLTGPLTLTGTGTPGSTIEVLANEASLGTAAVDDDGTWTLDTTLAQDGEVALVAQVIDERGQVAAMAETQPSISVTTPPTLKLPDKLTFTASGEHSSVGSLNLTGQGGAGDIVQIFANDQLLGETNVDSAGHWAFDEEVSLTPGSHNLVARVVTADGSLYTESDPITAEIPGPLTLTITHSGQVNELLMAGTTTPAAEVVVLANDDILAEVVADEAGHWDHTAQMTPGDYTFAARSEWDTGHTITSLPKTLTINPASMLTVTFKVNVNLRD